MSYFKFLKTSRWVRAWNAGPYYTLSIASSSSNGADVPELTKLEEAAIRDFFLHYGVEQDAAHDLWWKYERFGGHSEKQISGNTIYTAGLKFDMSKAAYDKVFGTDPDEYDDMSEMCDRAF